MSTPKAGYKGAVYLGAVKVGGSTTWSYSGETRNMQDIDEFEDEVITQVPLQIVGGDIEISGNYLLDSDAGQKLLVTDFDAATEIDDIKLYTDKTNDIYMTPTDGSHCIVTKCKAVGDDKSGVGTFSATLHVNGQLEQIGSTTAMAVATSGDIDAANGGAGAGNGTVTLWGELLSRGGLATDIDCYFEYGTTLSFGSDTSGSATTFSTPDLGEFDVDVTDLDEDTTYYYRAVAEDVDTNKVYGETKTFTIPADD